MDYSFVYKKNERFGNAIKDACEILLARSSAPLHIDDLYKLLRHGDFEIKSDYSPLTITILLIRDRRFYKSEAGTWDLINRASL